MELDISGMFTNIKIATMDSSELAKGDISLFGITATLFDATDAYVNDAGIYCDDFSAKCVVGSVVIKHKHYKKEGPCSL